jgi:hypothetical protein
MKVFFVFFFAFAFVCISLILCFYAFKDVILISWGFFLLLLFGFVGFVAIARLKEEAMQCSELNDLIPLKGNSNEDGNDKKNWMSSVQLWNTNNHLDCKKQDSKSEPKQVIQILLNFLDLEE